MNLLLAKRILQKALAHGVCEVCLCPGKRNAPLVSLLSQSEEIKKYFWFEERSAAFFALGRSRASGKPVAVITTSGTAAAELLPASMEAYYTGVPLLLITADRPRRFRGTNAPQTAEQVGIFGRYAQFQEDLAFEEASSLELWDRKGPAHINVCFEEPLSTPQQIERLHLPLNIGQISQNPEIPEQLHQRLQRFLANAKNLFVVVGELNSEDRESVAQFLEKLAAPLFLEGISGLREDPRLQPFRITRTNNIWQTAEKAGFPIDSILRIGGVPTFRLWRDLEDLDGKMQVCAISSLPYMGLSWGSLIYSPIKEFFDSHSFDGSHNNKAIAWFEEEKQYRKNLEKLFTNEPEAEASLVHQLSKTIPQRSLVYLGNSLPIREWDLAATANDRHFDLYASRGLNGIDGQISTFLGLSRPREENWAVLGDLTALYDMAGPWILQQLPDHKATIVVVNNSGGQIFSRMFKEKEFLHEHNLSFEPLAAMWQMDYQRVTQCESIGESTSMRRLIELVPDNDATHRFWDALNKL
jgi:2-succinyl-5-enolpyruvyl-6-hydroxy-3-cyclohexene-1-carboxylate synthase